MKIIIFNVKYSDNLGDGVIAECIEQTLKSSCKNSIVKSIDMSGREGFGSAGALSSISSSDVIRSLFKKVYGYLPNFIRERVFVRVSEKVIKKQLEPKWAKEIEDSDVVIIGGGQIFSDKLLYFPLRISFVSQLLKANSIPTAIYGVGVNDTFGKKALRLFSSLTAYRNLFFVSVRDKDSKRSLEKNFTDVLPHVTRDPALQVANIYKSYIDKGKSSNDAKVIGISVMQNKGNVTNLANEDLYYELGLKLVSGGGNVVYFTNGDPEDEVVKELIQNRMNSNDSIDTTNVKFLERLQTPRQLVTTISKFDAVVAHRLHANIISYSMKIPHVGIGWSEKMASFFNSVDRSEYFVEADENLNSDVVLQKILSTLAEGIDDVKHRIVLKESESGLQMLIEAIKSCRKSNS